MMDIYETAKMATYIGALPIQRTAGRFNVPCFSLLTLLTGNHR